MRRFLIPAAIAALTLSLNLAPAFADAPSPGVSDLGIDISSAGGTKSSVDHFLASMNAEGRTLVKNACERIVKNQTVPDDPQTYGFCQLAL